MRAIGWLMVFASLDPACSQGLSLETAVEATYLYKLAPFVQWPSPAAALPDGAFTICVVGDTPLMDLLTRAVSGQQIAGHPIVARRLAAVTADPPCSEMFVSHNDAAAVLAAVRSAPVLTVTNGATDPSATGIINFIVVDGHVRFDIDDAAAAAHGLVISSKLLGLAVHVTGRGQ